MFGYHLVSLLLHAASALLLVRVLQRLKVPGAWLAGAIFALHPIQVESVAWVSELKNTLSGFLYFAAGLAYLSFDGTRNRKAYAAALGLFILGLLSKSVIATLPAALLIVFWWRRGSLSWKKDAWPLAPFFAAGIAAGLFTAWFERKVVHAEGGAFNFTIIERGLIAGRALWFYAGKFFWPADLAFIYPRWHVSQTEGWQYLFPVAALLAVAAGLWWARRNRGLLAGLLFFAGTLFPALGFLNVFPFRYSFVADHFQYLACLGLITLTVALLVWLLNRWGIGGRPVGHALCLGLVALLAALTWQQSGMYTDMETLWRRTLAKSPDAFLAHNNLGMLLLRRGEVNDAIPHLEKALELQPDFAEAHNNLGEALLRKGQTEQAAAEFAKSLELETNNAPACGNLGHVMLLKGRVDEALALFRRGVAAEPHNVDLLNNLAYALLTKGQTNEAMAHLQEAVALRPDFPYGQINLADLLRKQGRLDEALAHYDKALALASAQTNTVLIKTLRERISQCQGGSPVRDPLP